MIREYPHRLLYSVTCVRFKVKEMPFASSSTVNENETTTMATS